MTDQRSSPTTPHIMLVAGEPSGDALGTQLMIALREKTAGNIRITGVGGTGMMEQGLDSLFPLADIAVMGLREVVPRIPLILNRVKQAAEFAMNERPDAVVLIDAPDFTHRIGRRLSKRAPDITIIKYVAPQVWASRPKRAQHLGEFIDHLMTLLPFEPELFEKYGLATTFVGHPVVERPVEEQQGSTFRSVNGITEDMTVLGVLPGSRFNEIRFLLPVFAKTVEKLSRENPNLYVVIPTVPHVATQVRESVAHWDVPVLVVEDQSNKFAAFEACDAALAASGTVSTELAMARVPMVIAYRVGKLTAFIALKLMLSPYITLINIIRKKEVIPEYVQDDCNSATLTKAVSLLLNDEAARETQLQECELGLKEMGYGAEKPSLRAAQAILDAVAQDR